MNGTITIPRPLVRTNQWGIVLSVVVSWITGYNWLLAIPLVAGLLGLFANFNPIMRLAKLFLRKAPSEYILEDAAQQKFNQWISLICLTVGLISSELNLVALGDIFTVMVAAAAFVAILGFCVGCFIRFQWHQFKYRHFGKAESKHNA